MEISINDLVNGEGVYGVVLYASDQNFLFTFYVRDEQTSIAPMLKHVEYRAYDKIKNIPMCFFSARLYKLFDSDELRKVSKSYGVNAMLFMRLVDLTSDRLSRFFNMNIINGSNVDFADITDFFNAPQGA